MVTSGQEAPGELERIRELLNSWRIPNDVRVPTDDFERYVGAHHRRRATADLRRLRALRDQLRAVVEGKAPPSSLDEWITRLKVRPRLVDDGPKVIFEGSDDAGALLAIVLAAVQDGSWSRLKACPDCRWVFFDSTRNGTKRWCLMNAGSPTGRACGTNAKVRRFRERLQARTGS